MEEKIMTVKIIGLIVGLLIVCAGIYYLTQEKEDPESRKIYGVISVIGAIIAVVKKAIKDMPEIYSDRNFCRNMFLAYCV